MKSVKKNNPKVEVVNYFILFNIEFKLNFIYAHLISFI